ncbi:MAG: ABC transporter permease, partial [Chloroflexi bacterium]|nr:ABC transporter permease [Chloroflexota bacterium]
MSFRLIMGTAMSAVGTNKLRTSLTLLGIIIGVSSVIALMSIGRGSQSAITERIQALGTNILFVSPAQTADGSNNELTLADVVALEDESMAPDIASVAAEASGNAFLLAGRNQTNAQVLGVTSNYLNVRDFELATGRPITPSDVINGTDVLLLGSELARTLFENSNPVGQQVKVNGRASTVIGVLEPKGGFGLEDNRAMAPITTVQVRLNNQTPGVNGAISQISVQ